MHQNLLIRRGIRPPLAPGLSSLCFLGEDVPDPVLVRGLAAVIPPATLYVASGRASSLNRAEFGGRA